MSNTHMRSTPIIALSYYCHRTQTEWVYVPKQIDSNGTVLEYEHRQDALQTIAGKKEHHGVMHQLATPMSDHVEIVGADLDMFVGYEIPYLRPNEASALLLNDTAMQCGYHLDNEVGLFSLSFGNDATISTSFIISRSDFISGEIESLKEALHHSIEKCFDSVFNTRSSGGTHLVQYWLMTLYSMVLPSILWELRNRIANGLNDHFGAMSVPSATIN